MNLKISDKAQRELDELTKKLNLPSISKDIKGVQPLKLVCECGVTTFTMPELYSKSEHLLMEISSCNSCVKTKGDKK